MCYKDKLLNSYNCYNYGNIPVMARYMPFYSSAQLMLLKLQIFCILLDSINDR